MPRKLNMAFVKGREIVDDDDDVQLVYNGAGYDIAESYEDNPVAKTDFDDLIERREQSRHDGYGEFDDLYAQANFNATQADDTTATNVVDTSATATATTTSTTSATTPTSSTTSSTTVSGDDNVPWYAQHLSIGDWKAPFPNGTVLGIAALSVVTLALLWPRRR